MLPTPPTRFYLLISIDPGGGVLGVYGDAADPGSALTVWDHLNDEIRLCEDLLDGETLPEPTGSGLWCICGEFTSANRMAGSAVAPNSPAPAWRRPTLDEMIAVIEGRTPANIRAWLDGATP
jgi:hypothetical protein